MSKNAMDMNFLIGKSYLYLKRLFGDSVNIPQDFIIKDNDNGASENNNGDEEFVSIKSNAAQMSNSQIIANGQILADIEQYEMTPTFSTQPISNIVPPVEIDSIPDIKPITNSVEVPIVSTTVEDAPLENSVGTPVGPPIAPPVEPPVVPPVEPPVESSVVPPVEPPVEPPVGPPIEKPVVPIKNQSIKKPPVNLQESLMEELKKKLKSKNILPT